MLFNSHLFIFLFLPITLVAFYFLPARHRILVLFISSSIFYAASGIYPLIFLYVSVFWAILFVSIIDKNRRLLYLVLGISVPFLILYLFKYLNFTFDLISLSTSKRENFSFITNIILPAGISFYTFQVVAYIIDVYDQRIRPEKNHLTLLAFISLFPQLIAGPILRFEDLRDELHRVQTTKTINPEFKSGIKFIAIGLFAKIFFADFIAKPLARFNVDVHSSALDATYSVLGYSFRIYYDFWAYSIIAIGLMKLFSFHIPKNFNEPYLAFNPKDFWRRWHMSLSYWVRDYIYIKLGGRKKYVRNITIIFAVIGLWHGAGLNFIFWGLYHAALVLVYVKLLSPVWDKLPGPLQIVLTFSLVSLGWPLFYLDFEGYLKLMEIIFITGNWAPGIYGMKQWLFVLVIAAWTFFMREEKWLYNENSLHFMDWPVLHAVLLYAAVLFLSWGETFIYFRF
jgi:alginate O-acetyltransferase complex protein AlgI